MLRRNTLALSEAAAGQVALDRDVDAVGELGLQLGVAGAVGLRRQVRAGDRIAAVVARARDQVRQGRRSVAARQAEADLVAPLRVGLPDGVQERRPDAAAVGRVGLACSSAAARRDRLPAQAGVGGPVRRHVPLVLRVGGVAQRARRQRVAEVARHRQAVLERMARVVAPVELELGAAHEAVVLEERRRQLDAGRVARVARRARVLEGARDGAVRGLGAKAAARQVGLTDAGARLDPATGGDAPVPLRVEASQRVAAAAFGRAGVVGRGIARRQRAVAGLRRAGPGDGSCRVRRPGSA